MPFKALFDAVSVVVGRPSTPGAFCRGLRTVAIDAATPHVPDIDTNVMVMEEGLTARSKR